MVLFVLVWSHFGANYWTMRKAEDDDAGADRWNWPTVGFERFVAVKRSLRDGTHREVTA